MANTLTQFASILGGGQGLDQIANMMGGEAVIEKMFSNMPGIFFLFESNAENQIKSYSSYYFE